MIGTLVRTDFMNLRRDRAALILTFIVPIAFFSIFAVIFGGPSKGMSKVKVVFADEDHGVLARRVLDGLMRESALQVESSPTPKKGEAPVPYTAASAEAAVKRGDAPVAIVIPKGFSEAGIHFGRSSFDGPKVQLLRDSSDLVAAQIIGGLLQKVTMTSMPDIMAQSGMEMMDESIGGLTPQQKENWQTVLGKLKKKTEERDAKLASGSQASTNDSDGFGGLIQVDSRDVVGATKKNPIIAFYAAGIAVMFMLFTASSAGGVLLDEADRGTLDRVLSTRVTMTTLLGGKLLYLVLIGSAQLLVMFLWGALMFKLELASHLPGFVLMTFATSLACASFGLFMATICRTRAQLGAISTLLILVLSSIGGSMVPKIFMPETVQKLSVLAFNSWAIDGFTKVFWREEPITHLWPQLAVLCGAAIVFLAVARRFARKWDYA